MCEIIYWLSKIFFSPMKGIQVEEKRTENHVITIIAANNEKTDDAIAQNKI